MTFLLWNLQKRDLTTELVQLSNEHQVDVFILTESGIQTAKLLESLNADVSRYRLPYSNCDKITVVAGYPTEFVRTVREGSRYTIREFNLPGVESFLFAATHIPSKNYMSEDSQIAEFRFLSEEIQAAEESVGHSRTVLVGDLNANPFEKGIISASTLNAVPTQSMALKRRRTISGRQYSYFYNPMWKFFGDVTPGPPGSYFYNHSQDIGHHWNIFDQVLIRPDLIERFDVTGLHILTSAQTTSLLTRSGVPNKIRMSDHLPVLFSLLD